MGILLLKKRVNRDKCSFTTKHRIFVVFAIDEPGSSVRALYATLGFTGLFEAGSLNLLFHEAYNLKTKKRLDKKENPK